MHFSWNQVFGKNIHREISTFCERKKDIHTKNVKIRPYTDVFAAEEIQIGNGCDIGTRNRIVGNVVIDKDVLIGPDNYICSADHCYHNPYIPIMKQGTYMPNRNGHKELRIGEGSWIGTHTAIIGDVHIGKNCVVGANSVVLKDVPDRCVVAGNPARIIKKWNEENNSWESFS